LFQLGDLNVLLKYEDKGELGEHRYQLFSASSGAAWNAASKVKADEEWHHLAVSSDAGKIGVHHDGKPVAGGQLSDLRVGALEPLVFGTALSDEGSESFRGEIKSIRISDTSQYRANQTFTPPPAQADQLLPDTLLVMG